MKQNVCCIDNLLSLTARGRLTFLKSKASNYGSVSGILELAPSFKMLEFWNGNFGALPLKALEFWNGNFGISPTFEDTRILEMEFQN